MNDDRRVVITGMSVVAGNGKNKEEFYSGCASGKLGIRQCTLFPVEELMTGYFGQVEQELVYEADSWKDEDRMEALMNLAFDQMLKDASFTREALSGYGKKACLCMGTLLSATGKIMAYARRKAAGNRQLAWMSHTVNYISELRKKSGVRGGIYIDSAACASSTTAAGMAFDFIRNGVYDMAVVGGADPLTEVSACGFHALQSLSTGVCNPFDENRNGINIGEGAAFFLFETLESAKARNARIYGEVLGYGLNNDAYHITSPDPEGAGAVASMKQALAMGAVAPGQVDYINTHGTGTRANDPMECGAIQKVFEGVSDENHHGPVVNSTKALVGHCMGASGAVELASILLGMEHGICFPMPKLKEPLKEKGALQLSGNSVPCEIRYALSNSFAFAGNTASLLVGSYEEEKKA